MANLRKQLGVDFLKRGRSYTDSENRPLDTSFLEEALLAFGTRILGSLARSAPHPAKLHDIVDELGLPIQDAIRVTDYLAQNGYILIEHRDLKGNHVLKITDKGSKLLSR